MTKKEIWTKVSEIAANHNLSEVVIKELAEILEPKKGGGGSSRIIKEIDGIIYKNCRFTGRLWPESELIYQNDEKREAGQDKGYSKVGISLWNKGQKYIKNLKERLTDEVMKDEPDAGVVKKLKEEITAIQKDNLGNNSEWLGQFATEEQKKEIESLSLPIE